MRSQESSVVGGRRWLFALAALLYVAVAMTGCRPAPESGMGESPVSVTVQTAAGVEAEVLRVIDGDTIWVGLPEGSEEKVRYIGIDAPEVAHDGDAGEYLGDEATAHNRALLESGRVLLQTDVDDRDDYGRLLAYVWSGGIFVNVAMVRDGYAFAHAYPPNLEHQDELWQAAKAARDAGLGVWRKI